jgi:hypothetical protein
VDGKGNLSEGGHGTVIFNSHSLVVLGAGVDQLGSEYSVRICWLKVGDKGSV